MSSDTSCLFCFSLEVIFWLSCLSSYSMCSLLRLTNHRFGENNLWYKISLWHIYVWTWLKQLTWVINKVYYFNIKQCIGNWLKLVPSTSMILFNVCPWHLLNTSTSISFCLIPDSFRSDKNRVTISYMAIIKQVSYRLDSKCSSSHRQSP